MNTWPRRMFRNVSLTSVRQAIAVLFFVVFGGSVAIAQTTVTWYEAELSANAKDSAIDSFSSFAKRARHILVSQLPEYQHKTIEVPFARVLPLITSETLSCHPAVYKTPDRLDSLHFSIPAYLSIPAGLVVKRKNVKAIFGTEQFIAPISLADTLKRKDLTIGYVQGRSHGAQVDKLLRSSDVRYTAVAISGQYALESAIRMLDRDRLDALIGYRYQIKEYDESIDGSLEDFEQIRIEEAPELVPGYVGCSKSPEGKAFIAKIDELLRVIRSEQLFDAYGDLYVQETLNLLKTESVKVFERLN